MWLLFHHYVFSSGSSSWKLSLVAEYGSTCHAHVVLCGGLGQYVETKLRDGKDFS